LSDTSNEDKPVLEEHAVPEHRGLFGGKKIETNAGKLERTTFLMTCDYCGKYPLANFLLCRTCGCKLCSDCSTKDDGVPYCRPHLALVDPLSRHGYKILLCIKDEIESVSQISKICRLDKDDVKSSLAVLRELKYITESGILSFLSRKITGDGIRILSVYSKIFSQDDDVVDVENRLKEETEEDNDGT
jgi:hypothetical protein